MEESKVINSDNTYNTDMSTSQSTIGGNSITNNILNKDDLQEVTGGGGGGIVTPPTTIVDGSETSQTTGSLTPILLILGDGTDTPDVEEEPVLLEEDSERTYNAVLNTTFESTDPTITLESGKVSYCDANYVIAVTETDKNTPISYNSNNLSVSYTNNENNWCSVEFKSPLDVTDQLKLPLNSTNFPDYSKIIVPVISCEENNTGQERKTTITFNIKNFDISHNIQMNVTQSAVVPSKELIPAILYMVDREGNKYTYKKYPDTQSLYYGNSGNYLKIEDGYSTCYNLAWFGLLDSNGKADNNLEYTSSDQLEKYNNKFGCSISGLTIEIVETNAFIKNTALTIVINTTQTTEVNGDFKITYDGKFLCNVKKIEKDI